MKYTKEQKEKIKSKQLVRLNKKPGDVIPIRIINGFYVVESKINFINL